MNPNYKKANSLIEMITWAVERILNEQYEVVSDEDGNLLEVDLGASLGPGMALSTKQIEGALKKFLPPNKFDALLALKKERTRQRLATVLETLFAPPEASFALSELKHASWEEILSYIDSYYAEGPQLRRKILMLIPAEREVFSSQGGAEVERLIEESSPGLISVFTVRKYAAEFRKRFPHIVGRAELLRLIPVTRNIPNHVRRYFVEASQCFIYGTTLASLFLCRSAVVAACEERLIKRGFEGAVEKIDRDYLKQILTLARDKGILDETLWKQADDIRQWANDAVHWDNLPDERTCMKSYDMTRGILQHLYG